VDFCAGPRHLRHTDRQAAHCGPAGEFGGAGRYLLVVNNATMARLDIPARRYATLPGTISPSR
jgi:hypothetical protein